MGTRVWASPGGAREGAGNYSTAAPFPVPLFPSVEAAINPRHLWRATNVLTTGPAVDAIVDSGRASIRRNFTATGADRSAQTPDVNGKTFLGFGNQRYVAGVAADWRFLTNGSPWTLGVVLSKPAVPFGTTQCLLATSNWGSGSPGILVMTGSYNNVTAGPGPVHGWTAGITGSGAPTCIVAGCTLSQPTGVQVIIVVHHGYRVRQNIAGMSAYDNQGGGENDPCGRTRCVAMEFWQNGRRLTEGYSQNQPYTTGDPQGALTLGKAVDQAIPVSCGLYEMWIDDRALTQWDCEFYSRHAAQQYAFAI